MGNIITFRLTDEENELLENLFACHEFHYGVRINKSAFIRTAMLDHLSQLHSAHYIAGIRQPKIDQYFEDNILL